ncbi:hypothetical protein DFH06DRAFT_1422705 [Mycena polygramma]|nr:hypothetical protein DFH06DRAFT_1422705 [Mycena polygramma]
MFLVPHLYHGNAEPRMFGARPPHRAAHSDATLAAGRQTNTSSRNAPGLHVLVPFGPQPAQAPRSGAHSPKTTCRIPASGVSMLFTFFQNLLAAGRLVPLTRAMRHLLRIPQDDVSKSRERGFDAAPLFSNCLGRRQAHTAPSHNVPSLLDVRAEGPRSGADSPETTHRAPASRASMLIIAAGRQNPATRCTQPLPGSGVPLHGAQYFDTMYRRPPSGLNSYGVHRVPTTSRITPKAAAKPQFQNSIFERPATGADGKYIMSGAISSRAAR